MAGFKFVGSESQGDITGKVKSFSVASTHGGVIGIGDLVITTAAAVADGSPTVDISTATATASTGVVAGVKPNFSGEALSICHLPASIAGELMVNVDAFALYEAVVSNGPLVVANVGLNAPSVVTVGTVNGSLFTSNMGINATGIATTATLPWRIVGLLTGDDGVLGSKALVRVNASTSNIGATGL